VNYEALNNCVLMAIGLFAALLYLLLLYAGFTEFMARISKKGNSRKRFRNRDVAPGLRNGKGSSWRRFPRDSGA
jgi:hypothetical protein